LIICKDISASVCSSTITIAAQETSDSKQLNLEFQQQQPVIIAIGVLSLKMAYAE
jgi:hypothetical protein